ncbi:class I SAM-dependent methyltransferase [Leptospira sp. 96542]|nr:class I SAM-dependent methyltransferase [Leptospira sp. 96542]
MDLIHLKDECPLNSNCEWVPLYKTTGNYKDLNIQICKTCNLQALNPRPKQNTLYNEEYYTGKAEYSYTDERSLGKYFSYVWDARIKNIQKFVKSGNFLDIGSSFGGLLARAKKKGFTVQGVEISKYASDYANANGISTFNGNLLDANFPSSFFSVITMIEVIEHIENPKRFFQEITRILKPGGLLVLQTANFEGWQAKESGSAYHYYMPGHVFYYSDTILKNILTHYQFHQYISYFGVDFGLIPKLKKSKGSFKTWKDFLKWVPIIRYHILSFFKKKGFPFTSSYVLYALKK